jgi:5-methylcytosine-specific restriction protein B
MSETIKFTVGGTEFALSKEEVERKLKGVEAENINRVYVEVNGKRYPVKQVFAVAAGFIRGGFTTHDAVRVLRKLLFSVGEV